MHCTHDAMLNVPLPMALHEFQVVKLVNHPHEQIISGLKQTCKWLKLQTVHQTYLGNLELSVICEVLEGFIEFVSRELSCQGDDVEEFQ